MKRSASCWRVRKAADECRCVSQLTLEALQRGGNRASAAQTPLRHPHCHLRPTCREHAEPSAESQFDDAAADLYLDAQMLLARNDLLEKGDAEFTHVGFGA